MRAVSVLVLCLLPSFAGAQAPSVQILHAFTASPMRPNGGLVQVPDGSFYGVTESGIIQLSIGGEVTQVARFHDGVGTGALVRASDGALYGTTYDGGPSNRGTVFRFDPATGVLRTLHGFASPTEGQNPLGGLVQVGGSLYGVTRYGPGRFTIGTIFHVVVATGAVITDAAFSLSSGLPSFESIYYPSGPLTPGPDGRLYGTAAGGGGALYAFDPVSRVITRIRGFSFDTDVDEPRGLTLGPDGSLYGNDSAGGIQRAGTIFRYAPATDRFEVVYRLFPGNGVDGRSPGPLLAASDGHFYGVTNRRNDDSEGGTVFRLRAGAGGTFTCEALRVLDPLVAGAPSDTVLTEGADGLIYGYAANGGPTASGTLFRFDPLGGGPPANPIAFTLVHTFPYVTTWGPSAPVAGPDGFLYGTTSYGGATNRGAVYRLAPATGAVTILGPMPGTGVATNALNSGLVRGPDGLLYGLATEFAPDRTAVTSIIRVDPASGLVTVVIGAAGPPLSWPFGPSEDRNPGLVRTAAGQLLGVRYDPSSSTVRVFRFDPAAGTVSDVAVRPALGVQSNLVPMGNGAVVALGTFAESGPLGLEWRSAVTRLNPAVASGYQEVRMTPTCSRSGAWPKAPTVSSTSNRRRWKASACSA